MMNYLCACKLCIKSCSPTNAQNVFAKSTLTSTLETMTHIAVAHACISLQDGATCKLRATSVCLWVCLASQEQKYLTHDWKRPGATKQGTYGDHAGWSWSILMVGIHDFKVHVTTQAYMYISILLCMHGTPAPSLDSLASLAFFPPAKITWHDDVSSHSNTEIKHMMTI